MSDLVRVPTNVRVEKNYYTENGFYIYDLSWQCVEFTFLTQDEAQTVIDMLVDLDDKSAEIQRLRERLEAAKKRASDLNIALSHALGYGNWRERGENEGAYWWRTDVRRLAGDAFIAPDLSGGIEPQSPPEPVGMGREDKGEG